MPMEDETRRALASLMEDAKPKSKPDSKRLSPSAITIDPNVRCERIYPVEDSPKTLSELKTVGIKLSRQQAIHLARVLLAVTQDWELVDITAYRNSRRSDDGTYHITVTSKQLEDE